MLLKDIRTLLNDGRITDVGIDPSLGDIVLFSGRDKIASTELLDLLRFGKDETYLEIYVEQSNVYPEVACLRPVLHGETGDYRIMLGTTWASKGALTFHELSVTTRTASDILDIKAPSGWSMVAGDILLFTDAREAFEVYKAYMAANVKETSDG